MTAEDILYIIISMIYFLRILNRGCEQEEYAMADAKREKRLVRSFGSGLQKVAWELCTEITVGCSGVANVNTSEIINKS